MMRPQDNSEQAAAWIARMDSSDWSAQGKQNSSCGWRTILCGAARFAGRGRLAEPGQGA
jgi:hypothetical protein